MSEEEEDDLSMSEWLRYIAFEVELFAILQSNGIEIKEL